MPLTVLQIAFPFAVVGPDAVGGAEQILSALDESLVAEGHRSLVVACAGSKTAGDLFCFPALASSDIDDASRRQTWADCRNAIARALASAPVDVIHMHGLDFHQYLPACDIPILVTLHMPVSWYPADVLQRLDRRVQFQCVSQAQRQTWPSEFEDAPVVENGVEMPTLSSAPRGRFAIALGRICPEKNFQAALQAGTRAGLPVLIGGQVFPYRDHQNYFATSIEPLLHGPVSHRFLGPLARPRKQQLLQQARCLLHPALAPETSSLVAMEAMAAGTPVIAYRSGALAQIVEHGVTGFLVSGVDEMAAAVGKAESINREVCRARAEVRFSRSRMAQGYFALYQEVALRKTAGMKSHHNSYEILHRTEELKTLRPEWLRLWKQDPLATSFQHPDWLIPWSNQFAPELASVAIRDHGTLVGLLPFYRYREPKSGSRQLLLLGAGTSDYLDGIFSPQCTSRQIAEALRTLQAMGGWDEMRPAQLRPGSRLLAAIRSSEFLTAVGPGENCSIFSAQPQEQLPQNLRRSIANASNRAQRRGNLALESVSPEECPSFLDTLTRFHAARRASRGEASLLNDPRVWAWLEQATPLLVARQVAQCWTLRLENEPVAALFSLLDPPERCCRTAYFYLMAFSLPHAEFSPGTLLMAQVSDQAARAGFAHIDLLRGEEGYKQRWHAEPSPTVSLVIPHRSGYREEEEDNQLQQDAA